ncbi:MAG: DUF3422 domain-containing protein [Alphaproteobacteria bacterium]|nr:DUF3422 domain-containing protein [Alphaproteobacteria bacterium]
MPLRSHPLRSRIVSEMHLRRMPPLHANSQMAQVVRLVDPETRAAEAAFVAAIPWLAPGAAPAEDRHVSGRSPAGAEFLWERHSEASTMTLILPDRGPDPFAAQPGDEEVLRWLVEAPGEVVRAIRIGVVADEARAETVATETDFSEADLVSCRIGRARIWSDFRVHADGFGRLLVSGGGMHPADLGRLVQRLQELGNYRNLALLGLPIAQAEVANLAGLEAELGRISQQLAAGEAGQRLLDELCAVSARTAAVADRTAFRMSATAAYAQIVHDRLAGLDCAAIDGFQALHDFVERRLLPATRTCASFTARMESLALRIERATALLRTGVEIAMQAQNAEVLRSMERTGARQLRLQRLVEGLSVVAVSYYALGVVGYAMKGLAHGLRFEPDLAQALAVAPVLALVWLYLRRRVHRIEADETSGPRAKA